MPAASVSAPLAAGWPDALTKRNGSHVDLDEDRHGR